MRRNSVLEEFRVKRLAVIYEEICSSALCRIADLGALESSDHHALLWRTRVQTETAMGIRQVKADISGMKLELQAIDWQELFGTLPIEDSWSAFKHNIQEIEARYVPLKAVHSCKLKLETDVDVSQGIKGCEA